MVSSVKHLFAQRRTELMGIAIVMVLLYHLYSLCPVESFRVFKHWYAGVDIFMFLSGWGLCYSYKKHTLSTFYRRRLFRILPLYIFQVIMANVILSIVQNVDSNNIAKQIIDELLTLFNMSIGGDFGNWYTSAILLLYIVFPILYFFVRKFRLISYAIVGLISCAIIRHYPDMQWQYNCILSRVPAFLLGIVLYSSNEEKKKGNFLLILVTIVLLNISYSYDISNYLTTSFISLVSIISIASVYPVKAELHSDFRKKTMPTTLPIAKAIDKVKRKICCNVQNLLCFCGKYSYELFLSNRLTALTIILLITSDLREKSNVVVLSCCYVTLTVFYGFVFVVVNKYIQSFLK